MAGFSRLATQRVQSNARYPYEEDTTSEEEEQGNDLYELLDQGTIVRRELVREGRWRRTAREYFKEKEEIARNRLAALQLRYVKKQVDNKEVSTGIRLFENKWFGRLDKVVQKVKLGEAVTIEDKDMYSAYKGYHLSGAVRQKLSQFRAKQTITHYPGGEIEGTGQQVLGMQMGECTLDEGGPTPLEVLREIQDWDTGVRSVFIGTYYLLYLPIQNRNGVLNLGEYKRWSYAIKKEGEEYNRRIPHSYGEMVRERLRILGIRKQHIVYLEFTRSHVHQDYDISYHISEYFNLVLKMQSTFAGVLVVVVPPVVPVNWGNQFERGPVWSAAQYAEVKRLRQDIANKVALYGHAVGVPVLDMFVQTQVYDEKTKRYLRQPHFKSTPLFTRFGYMTAEYERRFLHEYYMVQEVLEEAVLTPEQWEESRAALREQLAKHRQQLQKRTTQRAPVMMDLVPESTGTHRSSLEAQDPTEDSTEPAEEVREDVRFI